jgi:predicted N-acetyltransferase YhbS
MIETGRYRFKMADHDDELEQIHRLNHRTFAEELGQHAAHVDGRLVDKFHDKNSYFVALCGPRVVGMISIHDRPPFSVEDRLPDPFILYQPGSLPAEVRLLAVEPDHRTGPVFAGLVWSALIHARRRYTAVYISGVAERVALYERLGFQPLGPAVTSGKAAFVPMSVQFPLIESVDRLARMWSARIARQPKSAVNLAAGSNDKPAGQVAS